MSEGSSNSYIAVGKFDFQGRLIEADQNMCLFLGTTREELTPLYTIVNPSLTTLAEDGKPGSKVFSGIITAGNYKDISFDLVADITMTDEFFIISASPDIHALFESNKKMSRINQQVNNLQRELIREKRKLEKALQDLKETQQMLIQSEKMNALGHLVSGIAHEINNPIAFVNNNLHELKKQVCDLTEAYLAMESEIISGISKDPKGMTNKYRSQYDLDFILDDLPFIISDTQNGTQRVKEIVEDLRRFSRLDESDLKHIDIIENFKSTLSFLKHDLEKKKIDLKIDSPATLYIDCFPGQLNQALVNVMLNAIDAVDISGTIKVKITTNDGRMTFKIEDNGCGIEKTNLEKIFTPFFTTKPVGSGTGMGLSITYKIITDLHKGNIEVLSKRDIGTTIVIEIPIKVNDNANG